MQVYLRSPTRVYVPQGRDFELSSLSLQFLEEYKGQNSYWLWE